ncbi:hypothetical protein KM915_21105 [Cytobacillus oceanisediminis]|uniref:hypothetical protein n=1 Tax=Cytobacillus oceanisediminis TaxID=665099 RepID=UPI001C246CC5|nr:hypothetical protein [Cytobacillus oceanisediminis]MBU8732551.1 hypothetical protein [Cytobacillus oceanisediminis]
MKIQNHIEPETVQFLFTLLNNKKSFDNLPISARRDYEGKLSKQIELYYQQRKYDERNALVELKKQMVKNLPFEFSVNEEVLVQGKRVVKAIVLEMDYISRQVLLKPIDNVLKERFQCSEKLITSLKRKEDPQQMKLF